MYVEAVPVLVKGFVNNNQHHEWAYSTPATLKESNKAEDSD